MLVNKLNFLFVALLIFTGFSANAQSSANQIVGTWLNQEKEAKIEIYQQGEKFFGKIAWLKEPNENGKPKTDHKNPDKSKRDTPILGSVIFSNFKFDGNSGWENGEIYDAREGKTYSCKITLQSAKVLKVRGYIGISLFGRTNMWTRVE